MGNQEKISGVSQFELSWQAGRLVLLNEANHLLRRFGQLDLLSLEPATPLTTYRKQGADEIWALVRGEAELILTDLRDESPTFQRMMQLQLTGKWIEGILIPFGVQASLAPAMHGLLVRVTTHGDQLAAEDQIFQQGSK